MSLSLSSKLETYYAGIGSRQTPDEIQNQMFDLALHLANIGCTLRSGGADGADTAFYAGACDSMNVSVHPEIFKWQHGRDSKPARAMAQQVINRLNSEDGETLPPLTRMTQRTAGLLARNVQIVLGKELNEQCEFVVCWTPGGDMIGGTRHALKLASMFDISVYNYGVLSDAKIREALRENHGMEIW